MQAIAILPFWTTNNFMHAATAFVTGALFFASSPEMLAGSDRSSDLDVSLVVPATPADYHVDSYDGERPDGTSYWGVSATYTLSSGDLGEFQILVDSDGFGEAYFAINGEIISHTSIDEGAGPSPMLDSWSPVNLEYPSEVIAEALAGASFDTVNRMLPEPIKCSDFGKKATTAAKWLWKAATYAGAAACCTVSAGAGCVACATGTLLAGDAIADALDGHCD